MVVSNKYAGSNVLRIVIDSVSSYNQPPNSPPNCIMWAVFTEFLAVICT